MNATAWSILVGESGDAEEDCRAGPGPEGYTLDYSPFSFESDCRHPAPPPTWSDAGVKPGAYTHPAGVHVAPLPHGFHLVQSPHAPVGPAVLAPSVFGRWAGFRAPAPLRDAADRRLVQLTLLRPLDAAPRLCAAAPGALTVWLHITNACDLDCVYCYVRRSSARMSKATGLRAVEAVFANAAQHGFREVKLKYAGGEASLHFALVRRLHARAAELARQHDVRLREVLLTNAVHLRPTDVDWLAREGVRVMISLDGVGERHNASRPLRNREGADTFAAVAHTVDHVLLPRGIRPDVNMVVTARTAPGAADVARWAIIERELPTSFTFYRPNLLSRGRTDLELEEAALLSGMQSAYRVLERALPTWSFTGGLLDRVSAEARTHACGVGQNYLVITHTGALAQCQMHLDRPVRADLQGDLLAAVAAGPLINLPVEQKTGCRDCALRYRCAGGCPLETFRATGRWDVQSPHCALYRALLPAVLRLEGLRLMKAHGCLQ
ncbi:radical SAM protein [Promineifilum sp.]|uniref:radical SAM protein n=1 Tax=Promineifilum sp. TaxID=2664178 RepID=UPI0035AE68F7